CGTRPARTAPASHSSAPDCVVGYRERGGGRPATKRRRRPVPGIRRAWHHRQSRGVLRVDGGLVVRTHLTGTPRFYHHRPIWTIYPCRSKRPSALGEITSLLVVREMPLFSSALYG